MVGAVTMTMAAAAVAMNGILDVRPSIYLLSSRLLAFVLRG